MKSILVLGVGGNGVHVTHFLREKLKKAEEREKARVISVVVDRDEADMRFATDADVTLSLYDNASPTLMCDRLGSEAEDFFASERLWDRQGLPFEPGRWRKYAYLSFLNVMNGEKGSRLMDTLTELLTDGDETPDEIAIFTVASLAGGTGAGVFIPLTLFVKNRLQMAFGKANICAKAILTSPEVYCEYLVADVTDTRANAYAVLRELNAMDEVAYGANATAGMSGNFPIRFRLGTTDGPVGLLFDAEMPVFWTPAMAPFENVFLMGKITGVSSVTAHLEAVANALYSLICMKTDDEGTVLYCGQPADPKRKYTLLGSAVVKFPLDTLLDYFSLRMTHEELETDWLALHTAVEAQIEDGRERAKKERIPYILRMKDYAALFVEAAEAEARDSTCGISAQILSNIFHVTENDRGETEKRDALTEYWQSVKTSLDGLIPDSGNVIEEIGAIEPVKKAGFPTGKSKREEKTHSVYENARRAYSLLEGYFCKAAAALDDACYAVSNAVLPLTDDDAAETDRALSFAENVLVRDGYYIHPVSAMLQLCRFRLRLETEIASLAREAWENKDMREGKLPLSLLICNEEASIPLPARRKKKSAYLKEGADRFARWLLMGADGSLYQQKTDCFVDSIALSSDASQMLGRLRDGAGKTLLRLVAEMLTSRVDAMIDGYRRFFFRLAKQADIDRSNVIRAEKENTPVTEGACVYVGASTDARRAHYDRMIREYVPDAHEACHVAGKEAFDIVRHRGDGGNADVADVLRLVCEANRRRLRKTEYYRALRAKNLFEVIAEENENALKAGQMCFRRAYELARPSLCVEPRVTVYEQKLMFIPESMDRYLRENGQNAHSLLGNWSLGATIRVDRNLSGDTVLVCRAVSGIRADDMVVFNENSGADGYYVHYLEAIKRGKEWGADRHFPHLGLDWHKHGRLPFIDPTFDETDEEDEGQALFGCDIPQ